MITSADDKKFLKELKKKVTKKKERPSTLVPLIIFGVLLFIICFSYIYMLVFGVSISLKTLNDFADNIFGLPKKIYYQNYLLAFKRLFVTIQTNDGGSQRVYFTKLLINTLLFAIPPLIITNITQMSVAYVCTKYRFRFNKYMHLIVVFVFVMPAVNSLGQKIVFLRTIGFYDNYWALLYGSIIFADYNFLIWYGTWKGIPTDFIEAARIDGAGHYQTMVRIMFPMVRVQFLVLFVLGFITRWNDYTTVLTTMPSFPVLSYALLSFQWDTTSIASWPTVQIAAAMFVALPCIVLYVCFQPWLTGNLTMGGLKA